MKKCSIALQKTIFFPVTFEMAALTKFSVCFYQNTALRQIEIAGHESSFRKVLKIIVINAKF
jgi:hypothetical protein